MVDHLFSISKILRDSRYFSLRKKIGYIGWLGYGNLGDEAMYAASRNLFSKIELLPYKYSNKFEFLEKVTIKKFFEAVLLGGGTLINNNSFLRKFKIAYKKYVFSFVLGTGVRNPYFWDSIDPQNNCLMEWIEYLGKCEFVGVRGPLSKQILNENGFNKAEITGDPALFLGRDSIRKKERKLLGINIGVSNGKIWGNEDSVLNFIVKFAKIMIADDWRITFFPVREQDLPYIEEAAKRIGEHALIFYEYNSIRKSMDFLENCDLFVGEKLHSVILAMCTYTPSIMLEYRPKCLDFMMSMDLQEFNMRTDDLCLEMMLEMIRKLHTNLEYYQNKIFLKVFHYKKIQKEKANNISEVILKNNL